MSEFKDHQSEREIEGQEWNDPVESMHVLEESSPRGIDMEQEDLPALKYYEIIYGVLFDPKETMRRIVQRPPLTATLIIVILLSLVGLLTNLYTSAHGGSANLGLEMGLPLAQAQVFSDALRAAAPVLAILGAVFYFVKWFFYSALLHLLADFYGGRGEARTVFIVYGLAGLPEVFLIPLNVVTTLAVPDWATGTSTVGSLLVLIWGVYLLTLGLREAHKLSTGRALAVIFTPVIAVGLLLVISMVGLVSAMSAFMPPVW